MRTSSKRKIFCWVVIVAALVAPTATAKTAQAKKADKKPEQIPKAKVAIPPHVTPPMKPTPEGLHVFVSEDHTIYWPIDLPFWVRLANSADENAESFLLTQKMETLKEPTKNNSQDPEKTTDNHEGIKLEIPGSQFIRWFNYLSKNEVHYKFVADGGPPTLEYVFSGAQRFDGGQKVYFGPGLMVAIVAKDEHSGVESVYLSLNGGSPVVFTKPVPLEEERSWSLKGFALDRVGYRSPDLDFSLVVDRTPPTTTHKISGPMNADVASRAAQIQLSSKDALSGTKEIFYKFFNEKNYQTYRGPLSLETLSTGDHVLLYYAVDQVGNKESNQMFKFALDATPPDIAHVFNEGFFKSKGALYISPRTQIKLDASARVPVELISYQVKGGKPLTYTAPFSLTTVKGETELSYWVKDKLGNQSSPHSVKVIVDNTPPKTDLKFVGPLFTQGKGVSFITSQTDIVLSAVDDLSGVGSTFYQFSNQSPLTYSSTFKIPKEGQSLLHYWSQDHVGNAEKSSSMLVVVDNTPPEIVPVFSKDPKGQPGSTGLAYPVNTSLLVNAADGVSGVQEILVGIGKDTPKQMKQPISFTKAGTYNIKILAKDKVGNTSEKTLIITVVGG